MVIKSDINLDSPMDIILRERNPKFFNFEGDKSHEKFKCGQIWALYCDLDSLPKSYGQIKRVELSPKFRLELKWLEACEPLMGVIQWFDKKMPISCGTFTCGETTEFENTNSFSHLSTGVAAVVKNKFEIYPRKGEVWALYRNFYSEWSCSDLNDCQYDIVEVIEASGHKIKVLILSQVKGFETVFTGKLKAGLELFMEISRVELLRFSHQIPAFKLTDERYGKLRGCWELDPKAKPLRLFSTGTCDVSTFGLGSGFMYLVDAEKLDSDAEQSSTEQSDRSHEGNATKIDEPFDSAAHFNEDKEVEKRRGSPPLEESIQDKNDQAASMRIGKEADVEILEVPTSDFELDPASLSDNIEEITEPLHSMKENIDRTHAEIIGSSKSPLEKTPPRQKKRKNPDEINIVDGRNSGPGNHSPRLPDWSYKKKRIEECDVYSLDNTYTGTDCVYVNAECVEKRSSSPSLGDPMELPNPVFYDFEGDKSHEKFKRGQIWALYCNLDGLPKFYGQVKKVELSSNFRLELKWLEACEPPMGVIHWLDKKMPICCGTFTCGETAEFEDTNSFSHLSTVEAVRKNKFEIHPRKGQVWALYRNFNSEWSCTNLNDCEYDMVEVVEDSGDDIKVLILSQVQGFETVFNGKLNAGHELFMEISRVELLSFSHQIPAFKLTDESDGKLRGCWELDPKAMPLSLFSMETRDVSTFGIRSRFTCQADAEKMGSVAEQSSSSPSIVDPTEIPDAEFCNFEGDKSREKFKRGQIWALYCDLDGLPKFYGQIKRVEFSPNFRLELKWLEACEPPMGVIQWLDKKMPICCGTFTSGETAKFEDTNSFSHLSTGVAVVWKNKFEIYPRKGEVWALYSNFISEWSCTDLNDCEYDMAEIVEDSGDKIKVLVLCKLQGFRTVFTGKLKAGREFVMEISRVEFLRFAHHVPAFKLTDERDGKVRGCWELDPKAMPLCLFSLETHDISTFGIRNAFSCLADVKEMGSDGASANHDRVVKQSPLSPSHLNPSEIREAEFYNFENDKTREKFQPGQIWAIYCDLDGMPRSYVRIRRVKLFPDFKLDVVWFYACTPLEEVTKWLDKKMPISCGMFSGGQSGIFKDTASFSHQASGLPIGKRNKYEIIPRKGEVWALYRHCSSEWSCCDLHKCDYDIVEILEDHVIWIVVLVLRQIAGFETVFKAKRKAGRKIIIGVARFELFRFSHQVPAFRLTDERDGSLCGCWALDRKSIPASLFSC